MIKEKTLKPLIQANVIYWAKELIKKDFEFKIEDISDKIVDQPRLKTDQYCGNCGKAMTKKNDRNIKKPIICSEECRLRANLDHKLVTSKMLNEINEYLEIKHWAMALQKDVEGKKKKKTPEYEPQKRDDIYSCKKIEGTTLKQLGLEGQPLIGIVFSNGLKIKYLSNGKM